VACHDRANLSIHLIRNSFRFASKKCWDGLSRDLKPIYTAVNADAAAAALDNLDAKWGTRYPAIIRLWRNTWEEFIPFLDYGGRRRFASAEGRALDRWRDVAEGWMNLLQLAAP
jgi:transposase-like protein